MEIAKYLLELFLGKNFRIVFSNDTFLTIKTINEGVIHKGRCHQHLDSKAGRGVRTWLLKF